MRGNGLAARAGSVGIAPPLAVVPTTGKDGGIDDIAWRTGPSVAIGSGPLRFDPASPRSTSRSSVGIDYIPTAFGLSPPSP